MDKENDIIEEFGGQVYINTDYIDFIDYNIITGPNVDFVYPDNPNGQCSFSDLKTYNQLSKCKYFESQYDILPKNKFDEELIRYGPDCCSWCTINNSKGYCDKFQKIELLRNILHIG